MVMDYNKNYQYYKKKARDENFNGGSKSRSQNYYNNNNKSSYFGRRPRSKLSLEKEFCLVVGGVTWEKVLDTQKYMYQDEKVLNWKDSAVQEAFWNAKKRFLAKMRGEPCNIELPDPDIFIDEIDWDSDVDPKLILELDNTDVDMSCEGDRKYSGVIPEQYDFTSMGWGDAEEGDHHLEIRAKQDGVYDHWGNEGAKKDCPWWYDHWGDKGVNNPTKDCSNSWEEGYAYNNVPYDKFMLNFEQNRHDNNGGSAWNGYRNKRWEHKYNKKSNYGGRNTSRYKVSPVHYNRNDQPLIDGYGGRKRGNFSNSERPPLVQWKPVLRQR